MLKYLLNLTDRTQRGSSISRTMQLLIQNLKSKSLVSLNNFFYLADPIKTAYHLLPEKKENVSAV